MDANDVAVLARVPVRRAAGQRDGGRRPGGAAPRRAAQRPRRPAVGGSTDAQHRRVPRGIRAETPSEVASRPAGSRAATGRAARRGRWRCAPALLGRAGLLSFRALRRPGDRLVDRRRRPRRSLPAVRSPTRPATRPAGRRPTPGQDDGACHDLRTDGPADAAADPRPRAAPPPARALLAVLIVLLVAAIAVAGLDDGGRDTPAGAPRSRSATGSPPRSQQAQDRLRRVPGDAGDLGRARLGLRRAGQGERPTPPTTRRPRARWTGRSQLQPDGQRRRALVGLGALANARHDFAAARGYAEQALALNPASVEAQRRARRRGHPARRHRDRRPPPCSGCSTCGPGVAAFTRASYELELHGRVDEARAALRARAGRRDQPRRARVLPLLPRRAGLGRRRASRRPRAHYERGLAAAPGDPALLQGRAKVLAATGRVDEAIAGYDRLTAAGAAAAVPAGVRRAAGVGRPAAGRRRRSTGCSPSSSGSTPRRARSTTLAAAQLAADHGDPAEAVRLAQAEWQRRQSVFSADALAWALHAAGRDAEALPLTERAGALGRRDADGRLPPRDDPGRRSAAPARRSPRWTRRWPPTRTSPRCTRRPPGRPWTRCGAQR